MNISNRQTIRSLLFLVIIILSGPFSRSQTGIAELTRILDSSSAIVPDDQVFIHTDRNLYHPDDTIFFQTYIRNRFTLTHETASLSLYVILSDTAGEVVDSARFRIDHSLAPGYLKIPNYVSPGYYRLVGFTSKMQNFDPGYAFGSWIRIDVQRSEKVKADFSFDKSVYSSGDTAEINISFTDDLGEPLKNESFLYSIVMNGENLNYYNSKTNRNGESLVRLYLPDSTQYMRLGIEVVLKEKSYQSRISIPRDTDIPDLRFLPEGGTFIYGFSQRLAFNAVSENGKQIFAKGVIYDDMDKTIDTFESGIYGPGLVEFTPEPDRSYHAELENYPGVKFNLPASSSEGFAIRADVDSNLLNVVINGINEPADSCFLVLSMNNDLITVVPLSIEKSKQLTFDTGPLPAGTVKITLYNNQLYPVAERLVLINSHKETVTTLKSKYSFYVSGQESELEVTFNDSQNKSVAGFFSIAVIDSSLGYYSDLPFKDIKESFLFDDEFYNNLPGKIRFAGLHNISAAEVDILLMTYGWRKFSITPGINYQAVSGMQNYDLIRIRILDRMTRLRTKRLIANGESLVLMTVESPEIHSLLADNDNSFYFLFDSLGLYNNTIIIAQNNAAERFINSAKIEFPSNQSYVDNLITNNLTLPKGQADDFTINPEMDSELDSIMRIGDVNVWGKRIKKTDQSEDFVWQYQTVSSKTLDQEDIKYAVAFDQLLRRLHPLYINTGAYQVFFRPQQSLLGGASTPAALFVLDGIPIGNDYSLIAQISPQDIYFITAVKGVQGFYIYGERANGGVVFIETKYKHFGGSYDIDYSNNNGYMGDLARPVEIYRTAVEYYNPPSEHVDNNPDYWQRSTIFWEDELFYDGKIPVNIKYLNHRKKGPVMVIINGVSIDNQPVTTRYRYLIR